MYCSMGHYYYSIFFLTNKALHAGRGVSAPVPPKTPAKKNKKTTKVSERNSITHIITVILLAHTVHNWVVDGGHVYAYKYSRYTNIFSDWDKS